MTDTEDIVPFVLSVTFFMRDLLEQPGGFTFLNAEPEANEFYAVSMKDTDSLSQ